MLHGDDVSSIGARPDERGRASAAPSRPRCCSRSSPCARRSRSLSRREGARASSRPRCSCPARSLASDSGASEADELIGFLGLGRYASNRIADLSTGTRRIVELAGLLALDARVLCLDEPTAGVAQRETEAFGPLIKEIRRELGAAMLVIEHDMPLIMSISDRVYCLEVGRVIAEGAPADRAPRPEGDRELPRCRRTRHRPQRHRTHGRGRLSEGG